jgi:hypothetical protein
MGVVIRILDNTNNVLGDLDLANFKDFPLALTKGIVNLDNLKARTGTYSKTFKVPNTKNNSKLLSNVDNINSKKDYRDALNRKPCVIIVNNNQNDSGFLQVSKSINKDYFELIFFGNNIDWVKSASELKLNTIAWRNNSQVYNQAGVTSAWLSNSNSDDHAYPYISRGGNKSNVTASVEDFYPCFYIRSILERGLNQLGWNVSSNFLVSNEIKLLVGDLSNSMTVADSVVDQSRTRASRSSDVTNYGGDTKLVFNDDATPPNEDVEDNYNTSTGFYVVPTDGTYNINVSLTTDDWHITGTQNINLKVKLAAGNSTFFGFGLNERDNQTVSIPTNGSFTSTYTLTADLKQGENVAIFTKWIANPFSSFPESVKFKAGTFFDIQRSPKLAEGDSFLLSEIIPDSVKLIDVINDFTRMFNIYYWTDVKTKTIYFEPRNSFFKPITEALDWTDKIDFNKNYEIDYINTYKRNVEFKYKELNNDEWLKGWQDVNKRTFARYNHILPDRFAEGTNTIELGLFSASYGHAAYEISTTNSADTSPSTLKIWNNYQTEVPTERINSYNPKIFFNRYFTQEDTNGVNRKAVIFNNTSTFIPYGIFQTYNNVTTPMNLSFTGADGLFSTYYANMFKNIEDGGRLTAYLRLDDVDINNLDFRNLVYISTPSEITGYYIVEKVQDYKPLSDGTTKVNLFKFEDLGNVAIDASQKGNNGNENNENNTPSENTVYVVNNGQIINVCVLNQSSWYNFNFERVIL